MDIEKEKKSAQIEEQISSGKITINQAREQLGLAKHRDKKADEYIMSEK